MKNIIIIIILLISLIILFSWYNAFITEDYGNSKPNSKICNKINNDYKAKMKKYKTKFLTTQYSNIKLTDQEKQNKTYPEQFDLLQNKIKKNYDTKLNLTASEIKYNEVLQDNINNYIIVLQNFIQEYNSKEFDNTDSLENNLTEFNNSQLDYETNYNTLLKEYQNNNKNNSPSKNYDTTIGDLIILANIENIKKIHNQKIKKCIPIETPLTYFENFIILTDDEKTSKILQSEYNNLIKERDNLIKERDELKMAFRVDSSLELTNNEVKKINDRRSVLATLIPAKEQELNKLQKKLKKLKHKKIEE